MASDEQNRKAVKSRHGSLFPHHPIEQGELVDCILVMLLFLLAQSGSFQNCQTDPRDDPKKTQGSPSVP